jgi:hypothetical protein
MSPRLRPTEEDEIARDVLGALLRISARGLYNPPRQRPALDVCGVCGALERETLTPSGGSSVTFTGSGSMRSGRLSPRAPLVPHTDDDACTSWRTPVARDFKGYTKREGESICNQLRAMYGGSGRPNPRWLEWLMGFPRRLVRHAIHALGNAVVPQVAEHIGRIVIAYEGRAAA